MTGLNLFQDNIVIRTDPPPSGYTFHFQVFRKPTSGVANMSWSSSPTTVEGDVRPHLRLSGVQIS